MTPTPLDGRGRNPGAGLPPMEQRARRRVFTLGLMASALLVWAATFLSVAVGPRPGAGAQPQDTLPVAEPPR